MLLLLVFSLLLAYWPVWKWYGRRLLDRSDEPLGIVALITAVVIILGRSKVLPSRSSSPRPGASHLMWLLVAGQGAYLLLNLLTVTGQLPGTAMLIDGFFAVTAVGLAAQMAGTGAGLYAGDWLLLYLSLPLVASLNFYLGYPLRLLVTEGASALLSIAGTPVESVGTTLAYGQSVVQIDAPCSGIKMLWAALYTVALLSSCFAFDRRRCLTLLSAAMIASVLANTLRVTSLFYIESGIVQLPLADADLHKSIGLVSFFILTLAILASGLLLAARKPDHERIPPPTAETEPLPVENMPGGAAVLCALCLLSAALPLRCSGSGPAGSNFTGWPTGRITGALRPLPLPEQSRRAFRSFPGKIRAFTDGERIILMRWVTAPTRQLHPASDCYRALGYRISWLPLLVDTRGSRWSRFAARKEGSYHIVSELICDEAGNCWSDPSSWFWAAALRRTRSPWWAITIEEPQI